MKRSHRLSLVAAIISLVGFTPPHSANAGSSLYFGMDYDRPSISIGYGYYPQYSLYPGYEYGRNYGYNSRRYSGYGNSWYQDRDNYRRPGYVRRYHNSPQRHKLRRYRRANRYYRRHSSHRRHGR